MRSKVVKRRTQGVPNRELAAREKITKSLPVRALIHVTAVGYAREIIGAGQLDARPCKFFKNKELAYFFALRPAYRLRDGTQKTDKINYFPCIFVVSPDGLREPFHVYPFDTGGMLTGVFDQKADRTVPIDDYELDPSLEAVGRHMAWAFGDLSRYLAGDLRLDLLEDVPRHETVTRGFADIAGLSASGHNAPDKRASAIEVAYDRHIPLKGNVRLIILPKQYIEDTVQDNTAFMDRLRELDIQWRLYDWLPNRAPDDFIHEITDVVMQYYRDDGIL